MPVSSWAIVFCSQSKLTVFQTIPPPPVTLGAGRRAAPEDDLVLQRVWEPPAGLQRSGGSCTPGPLGDRWQCWTLLGGPPSVLRGRGGAMPPVPPVPPAPHAPPAQPIIPGSNPIFDLLCPLFTPGSSSITTHSNSLSSCARNRARHHRSAAPLRAALTPQKAFLLPPTAAAHIEFYRQ
ncbi:unnamed protein product [Boreogadus saida]